MNDADHTAGRPSLVGLGVAAARRADAIGCGFATQVGEMPTRCEVVTLIAAQLRRDRLDEVAALALFALSLPEDKPSEEPAAPAWKDRASIRRAVVLLLRADGYTVVEPGDHPFRPTADPIHNAAWALHEAASVAQIDGHADVASVMLRALVEIAAPKAASPETLAVFRCKGDLYIAPSPLDAARLYAEHHGVTLGPQVSADDASQVVDDPLTIQSGDGPPETMTLAEWIRENGPGLLWERAPVSSAPTSATRSDR
jgi:hypothetical protein